MQLIPAIDLMNGKIVRLSKGDPKTAKVYEQKFGTPLEAAKWWRDEGAGKLHIIDLDAAFVLGNNHAVIAEIAKNKGAKLIHISTDYVFDGTKEGDYTEDDNPNPINVYGKSKYQGEQNIQGILKEYFIIRTSWLYGHNGSNFVKTMLRLCQEKPQIRVVMIIGEAQPMPTIWRFLSRRSLIRAQLHMAYISLPMKVESTGTSLPALFITKLRSTIC